jgi:hypothetical protein
LAIINLTNQILPQINKKSSVCGIFCDLTKAFDNVNHDILMTKLQYYGIAGKFGELIKFYLNNRHQRVTIKSLYASNYVSSWKLVKHGVPQGPILVPHLFLFYINYLPQLVKGKTLPILFADDTSFIIQNSDSEIMDQDVKVVLQTAQRRFNSNRMLLIYNKTKFMQFFPNISHQPLDTTEFNTCKINFINSFKFLGVIIESSLTWKEHFDYINLRLNSLSYMVCSLRPVLELKTLELLYFSYVH